MTPTVSFNFLRCSQLGSIKSGKGNHILQNVHVYTRGVERPRQKARRLQCDVEALWRTGEMTTASDIEEGDEHSVCEKGGTRRSYIGQLSIIKKVSIGMARTAPTQKTGKSRIPRYIRVGEELTRT